MLQIKNLTINHINDLRVIISDFSLSLNYGDKVAIIGEEGNGKSTLLKIIYDENLVKDYIEYRGNILKKDLQLGYLAQELKEEEQNLSVYEYCSMEDKFYELNPKELFKIAKKFKFTLEFFYSEQLVKSLSGGERVKLQLARILMKEPDVLLLDEPSNDIDISTLQWLESFINSFEKPILYISHDELLLENTANIIVHLEQIKRKSISRHTIMKIGYRDYVETRLKKLEHQEQVAKKQRSDYEKQQERYRKIYQKVEHEQNAISRKDPSGGRLLKKKMHSVKSMGKRFEREAKEFEEIPSTEDSILIKFNEKVSIPNGKTILDLKMKELKIQDKVLSKDIVLNVMGAEHIAIIGDNGVGKTTLIKKISESLMNKKDIKAFYMPQNYEDLLDLKQKPIDFLCNTGNKEEKNKISLFLACMKYTRCEMEHNISDLSGGQKAKLILLKAILDECNVLILDEPTRNFSSLSSNIVIEELAKFSGTIISVSHDRKYINKVCNSVYELSYNGLTKINVN